MNDILYTIIIPHKNIPDLLNRCLNSIPIRDDIQIIVVDDNSNKDVVDFNNFPGVNRKNVEFILSKEGKGAGYARNLGLKKAKGKWLLFADADDFYNKSAWKEFDKYNPSEFDIVYFGVDCVNSITMKPENRNLANNIIIKNYLSDKKNSKNETLLRFTCWEPWNKLFAKKLIDKYNITFEEVIRGNDAMFVLTAGLKANKITATYEKLYTLTLRENSITFIPQKESYLSSFKTKLRINNFYVKNNLKYLRILPIFEIKEAYKIFGLYESFKYIKLTIVSHNTIGIFFDLDRWKRFLFKKG